MSHTYVVKNSHISPSGKHAAYFCPKCGVPKVYVEIDSFKLREFRRKCRGCSATYVFTSKGNTFGEALTAEEWDQIPETRERGGVQHRNPTRRKHAISRKTNGHAESNIVHPRKHVFEVERSAERGLDILILRVSHHYVKEFYEAYQLIMALKEKSEEPTTQE